MEDDSQSHFETYLRRSKPSPKAAISTAMIIQKREANIIARNQAAERSVLDTIAKKARLANSIADKEVKLVNQEKKVSYSLYSAFSKEPLEEQYVPSPAEVKYVLSLRKRHTTTVSTEKGLKSPLTMTTNKNVTKPTKHSIPQVNNKALSVSAKRARNVANYEQIRRSKDLQWLAWVRKTE